MIIISAIDKTCELVSSQGDGHRIHGYVVDLADRKAVYKSADLVRSEVGAVDILINNAGVVYGRTLMDLEDYMIENTYKVNILSHYWVSLRIASQGQLSQKCILTASPKKIG